MNVILSGQEVMDHLVPMQSTALIGAQAFMTHRWSTDIVYIDASHTSLDVLIDLTFWWPLVSCNGALVGDDLDQPAVLEAVNSFIAKTGVHVKVTEANSFLIRKRCGSNGAWYTTKDDVVDV